MEKSLIIYSGGMDSQTLLYEYANQIKLAVSFNYGSNHNDPEFNYAQVNTTRLKIPHQRIDLKEVFKSFKSSLLSGPSSIPEGHYADENMKQTVVPFRNGIMLSIAAGIAASNGMDSILIGVHGGDHTIYPDCREEFLLSFDDSVRLGLWESVGVLAPYIYLTKREIALRGKKLGIDYGLSYTCYKGGAFHCGKCGACVERKEALVGFDPTKYLE